MTPHGYRALADELQSAAAIDFGVSGDTMFAAQVTLRAAADQLEAVQAKVDTYMQKVAARVIDVFENADDDATAEDVMPEVFAAVGLLQHHGVPADTAPQEDRDF